MNGLYVGKIVHHVFDNNVMGHKENDHHAAIVTGIIDGKLGIVELHIWMDGGARVDETNVVYDENKAPGTWHFIEEEN